MEGHHVERLIEHIIYKRNSMSFYVMILHHYITIILMVNCLIHRQYLFGIPVLLLHDMADSFANLIRLVREIKQWNWLIIPVYLCFLFVWVFTRNTIFNIEIMYPLLTVVLPQFVQHRTYHHIFATAGLCILLILNTYWIWGIAISGYNKIFKKKDVFIIEEPNKSTEKSRFPINQS